MNKKLIFIFTLLSSNTFAQMTKASFFPEMKSVNPSTLNQRDYGQVSASFGKSSVEKIQDLDTSINEKTTWNIDVDSKSFFYGGKAGKSGSFLNPEFQYLKNGGTRKVEYTSDLLTPISTQNDINFTHIELGLGIAKYFGLTYSIQDYQFKSDFKFSLDGIDFEERLDKDISSSIIKLGVLLPLNNFSFSGYYEQSSREEKIDEYSLEIGQDNRTENFKSTIIGIGAGMSLKNMRAELGYERIIQSDNLTGTPSRLSGTVEYRFWKLALGYTGRIYKSGFESNEMLVYNQLVYPEQATNSRLENTFNFAYGANGGLSFGGSFSASKVDTKEKNPFISVKAPPQDTKVKTLEYSIKVGYAW